MNTLRNNSSALPVHPPPSAPAKPRPAWSRARRLRGPALLLAATAGLTVAMGDNLLLGMPVLSDAGAVILAQAVTALFGGACAAAWYAWSPR